MSESKEFFKRLGYYLLIMPSIICIVFISIIKTKRIKCKEEKNEPND